MFVLSMSHRLPPPEPPPPAPPPEPISTPGPTSGIPMPSRPPAPTPPTPTPTLGPTSGIPMPPTPTPPQDGAETSTTPTTPDRPQDAAGTSTTPTPTPDRRPSIAISSPPTRESYGAKIDAAISPDPQTDVALFTNLIISGYEDSAARQITNRAVAMGQVANTNMAAYKPDREMLARVIVGGKPDRNKFPPWPRWWLSLCASCLRLAASEAPDY